MATFASSVASLLPESDIYALKTDPAWHHPRQWAIALVIYTEQSVRLYTSRNGKSYRLSNVEYDRLMQHGFNQLALWLRQKETGIMWLPLVVSEVPSRSERGPIACLKAAHSDIGSPFRGLTDGGVMILRGLAGLVGS
ncbi:uncharacterized protein BT62DRAFT_1010708 [Guyanagaster necrorhizus]|uniref:Uncharacterized protein n=1 Tax=Guyanagaster necrorhizus TaxID=856835 RepID=A0A9P8ANS7_9AGAR|nr:uncharacterized protein BT62DRAFT_1010708 [Guyanagaster necrorhizus MCA 3950]KAG7442174.1 hypothetical protein BT62DRAFT_1010708 [Guyanagaster necrorhizus MCA 3950]